MALRFWKLKNSDSNFFFLFNKVGKRRLSSLYVEGFWNKKSFLCRSLFLYYIKQIDSMLPCVCSVKDPKRHQIVVRTSVAHSAIVFCFWRHLWSGAWQLPIFLPRRLLTDLFLVWIYLEFRSPQEPQWPIAATSTDFCWHANMMSCLPKRARVDWNWPISREKYLRIYCFVKMTLHWLIMGVAGS